MGLWRGYVPNAARFAVISAAELASYDHIKQTLLRSNMMRDDIPAHLLSGLGAGFVAAVVGSPVDVLKVRVMSTQADGSRVYKGTLDCVRKSLQSEGAGVFYRGFWSHFARLGSWNVLMFVVRHSPSVCVCVCVCVFTYVRYQCSVLFKRSWYS